MLIWGQITAILPMTIILAQRTHAGERNTCRAYHKLEALSQDLSSDSELWTLITCLAPNQAASNFYTWINEEVDSKYAYAVLMDCLDRYNGSSLREKLRKYCAKRHMY